LGGCFGFTDFGRGFLGGVSTAGSGSGSGSGSGILFNPARLSALALRAFSNKAIR
jgi:hypothetical protein